MFRVVDGVLAKFSVHLMETDNNHYSLLQFGIVARNISVSWRKIICTLAELGLQGCLWRCFPVSLCAHIALSGTLHDNLKRSALVDFCGEPSRYKRNGLLPMLKRNTSVKLAPQRWQDNAGDGVFDMIMTFEERVFDLVVEGNSFTIGLELDFCLGEL